MEKEYLYPSLADRTVPREWENMGKKDSFDRAHERAKAILSDYYPIYIDPKVDSKIRDRFPILLKTQDMKNGNGRCGLT